jgi:hypothetical protein
MRLQFKFNVIFDASLLDKFENETNYIFRNKEMKELFLKQNLLVLKKFDNLKKYITFNKLADSSKLEEKPNYFSFIYYYNSLQVEIFPYLYMLPSLNEDFLYEESFLTKFRKKYFSLNFLESWFLNLINGFKEYIFFLKIKFFFFNFHIFLKNIIGQKLVLSSFFQKKINDKILDDEKLYMLLLNKNIDPAGLSYLNNYSLWHYLYKDSLMGSVDESFLFNNNMESFETSLFFDLENKFFDLFNLDSFQKKENYNNLSFVSNHLIFNSLLFKEKAHNVNLFLKFFFFNNIITINKFLLLYYFDNSFFQKLGSLLENSDIIKKFDVEYVEDLLKNIVYNPAIARTFFLEKLSNMKERGAFKFYDSYTFFLKKYFFILYFLNYNYTNFAVEYPSFNFFFSKQLTSNLDKKFVGFFLNIWFFLPSRMSFDFSVEQIFNEYLKLGSKIEGKNENNKYFVYRTSGGFLKYSIDFTLRISGNAHMFSLNDDLTYYNKNSLLLNMFQNLLKVKNLLSKN